MVMGLFYLALSLMETSSEPLKLDEVNSIES
jgi:hypothetical protein